MPNKRKVLRTCNEFRCDFADCKQEIAGDIVVKERRLSPDGKRLSMAFETRAHIRLCKEHFEEFVKFLEVALAGEGEYR